MDGAKEGEVEGDKKSIANTSLFEIQLLSVVRDVSKRPLAIAAVTVLTIAASCFDLTVSASNFFTIITIYYIHEVHQG